jgi:hypothetical protein
LFIIIIINFSSILATFDFQKGAKTKGRFPLGGIFRNGEENTGPPSIIRMKKDRRWNIACVKPDFLMGKEEKSACESGNNTIKKSGCMQASETVFSSN